MIREAIAAVVEGRDLTEELASNAMREIMEGEATPAQIGGFLIAMRMKGETVEEIAVLAREMREKAVSIHPRVEGRIVDTCGTGGDGLHTFNISTVSMFVVSGAGVPVAKHGNRSVSSNCGSADLLESLGARMDLQPPEVERMMEKVGMCFMFAPVFHPAMKHALGPRREMGVRTFFNILGPLTNPCGAKGQVMGVYDGSLTEKLARALGKLGVEKAYVVHGEDGQDEVSITRATTVSELQEGAVKTYSITPESLGIRPGEISDLIGGDAETNARIAVDILSGLDLGPRKDAVLVNAAAAIAASGKADSIPDGMPLAREAIEKGDALKALFRFIEAGGGDSAKLKGLLEGHP
jgi:anthranilate phosphoribosyltransferase